MTPTEAGQIFVTPAAYADPASFHEACAVLRREDPIHLVEHPEFPPFHAITRHADVLSAMTVDPIRTTTRLFDGSRAGGLG